MGLLRKVASPCVTKYILVSNKPMFTNGHIHGDGVHMYENKFEK